MQKTVRHVFNPSLGVLQKNIQSRFCCLILTSVHMFHLILVTNCTIQLNAWLCVGEFPEPEKKHVDFSLQEEKEKKDG